MKKTDLSYLISMTGNDPKLIYEMIEIFIDQVKELGDEMQEAYEAHQYDILGKLAHKAKSSVQIMGMKKLSKKLNELELFTNENINVADYLFYIDHFKEECRQAIKELTDYKNEISS